MGKGIIKSFWKMGYPWIIMLGLSVLYTIYKQVMSLSEELFSAIIDFIVIVACIAFLALMGRVLYFLYKRVPKPPVVGGIRDETFSHQPWLYNKRIVILTAKVERVLDNEMIGILRRFVEHLQWALSSKEEPYIPRFYQRILLSSPKLEEGQLIALFHDRAGGKLNYQPGAWLEIQGQYIDQKTIFYGFWGSRFSFYGGLYNAYGSCGYVRLVENEPKLEDLKEVEVLPKVKREANFHNLIAS